MHFFAFFLPLFKADQLTEEQIAGTYFIIIFLSNSANICMYFIHY